MGRRKGVRDGEKGVRCRGRSRELEKGWKAWGGSLNQWKAMKEEVEIGA